MTWKGKEMENSGITVIIIDDIDDIVNLNDNRYFCSYYYHHLCDYHGCYSYFHLYYFCHYHIFCVNTNVHYSYYYYYHNCYYRSQISQNAVTFVAVSKCNKVNITLNYSQWILFNYWINSRLRATAKIPECHKKQTECTCNEQIYFLYFLEIFFSRREYCIWNPWGI